MEEPDVFKESYVMGKSTLEEAKYRPQHKVDWDEVILKYPSKDGDGTNFIVVPRDTKGMKGSQDKFEMYSVDSSGKVIMSYGSHPSLDGTKKFAKAHGYLNESKSVVGWRDLVEGNKSPEDIKAQIVKIMIKRGNNPEEAKDMVDKNYDEVARNYKTATPGKLADIIRVIA